MNREEEMKKIREYIDGLTLEELDVVLEKAKKLLAEVNSNN